MSMSGLIIKTILGPPNRYSNKRKNAGNSSVDQSMSKPDLHFYMNFTRNSGKSNGLDSPKAGYRNIVVVVTVFVRDIIPNWLSTNVGPADRNIFSW